jgi:hypothetical protein
LSESATCYLGHPAKNDCSTEVLLDFYTRMTFLRSIYLYEYDCYHLTVIDTLGIKAQPTKNHFLFIFTVRCTSPSTWRLVREQRQTRVPYP